MAFVTRTCATGNSRKRTLILHTHLEAIIIHNLINYCISYSDINSMIIPKYSVVGLAVLSEQPVRLREHVTEHPLLISRDIIDDFMYVSSRAMYYIELLRCSTIPVMYVQRITPCPLCIHVLLRFLHFPSRLRLVLMWRAIILFLRDCIAITSRLRALHN